MDATERARRRFAETVTDPPAAVRLDVAALLHRGARAPGIGHRRMVCPARRARGELPGADVRRPARRICSTTEGFRGNLADYGDPENSFLDSVITRRLGIPITLSVVMMEVGRRLGVDVQGIGMPGHFLVQDGGADDMWCDPFHGGVRLDLDGCRRLFARLHGPRARVPSRRISRRRRRVEILGRMLANLEHGRLGDRSLAVAVDVRLASRAPRPARSEQKRLDTARQTVRARWN